MPRSPLDATAGRSVGPHGRVQEEFFLLHPDDSTASVAPQVLRDLPDGRRFQAEWMQFQVEAPRGCAPTWRRSPSRCRTAAGPVASEGKPLSSAYLDGFDEIALPDEDGNPPTIHPHHRRFDVGLGPVHVAGWRRAKDGAARPMLHSKMLVLGVTTYQPLEGTSGFRWSRVDGADLWRFLSTTG